MKTQRVQNLLDILRILLPHRRPHPPVWDNGYMRVRTLPRPNEQRKVENLLVKLAKLKPISAKPVQFSAQPAPRSA